MQTRASSGAAGGGGNPPGHGAAAGRFPEDKVLLVVTLIIGAVVGLVVVAFIVATENLGSRLYPAGGAAWRRVLVPVAGALVAGFLLFRYFPNARGSGIPQTKAALFLRDGFISLRTAAGKFGVCSISLASGIALGREGPSVQVGAGIASVLGRKLGLSDSAVRSLIPTGASAALAAAFNTPISAVLFSLEEVMGDLHAPVLGSIVLASATSWIVLHLILGDEPLFHVPAYQLVHPVEFLFYGVLGLAVGLFSGGFVKLLLWERKHFLRVPRRAQWLAPAAGGITTGLLGWFFPEVLGVGYANVGKALNGQMAAGAMALLAPLKALATATCYASGNAGGIFGPSLFLGAMVGGTLGGIAHGLAPDYTGSAGAYALVGMGAAFSGIVRAPLTSVIMVFELTRDYSIVVPLMIANLISYYVSSRLQKVPIYEALQEQEGIRLPAGARARESLLTVGFAYRQEGQLLSASETAVRALATVERERGAWPVIDEGGFRGMVSLERLEAAAGEGMGNEPLLQLVAPEEEFPRLYPDESLDRAMRWLADGRTGALPVFSRANPRELKGSISLSDVLAAYALGRSEAETGSDRPGGTRIPAALLGGIVAAVAVIATLAGFLSYYYRAERVKRADQYSRTGGELFRNERYPEAIEQYRNALSISHSADHRLALGQALVKAERMNEAAIYLDQVLRERPGSGPANLAAAEADAGRGRTESAIVHYRRAIAGTWPEQEARHRSEARMEFAGWLAKAGRKAEARAELMAAAADPPGDPAARKQVGRMLLDFGLAANAADLYAEMLKTGPPDAEEYGGLGEAEFRQGDYRRAGEAFRMALEIDPGDRIAKARAALCEGVVGLDPAQPGIGSRERFRRSGEVLSEALERLTACAPAESGARAAPDEAVTAARTALARKRAPASYSDAAEANAALAERLWAERGRLCGPAPEDAIALVMRRLAAHSGTR